MQTPKHLSASAMPPIFSAFSRRNQFSLSLAPSLPHETHPRPANRLSKPIAHQAPTAAAAAVRGGGADARAAAARSTGPSGGRTPREAWRQAAGAGLGPLVAEAADAWWAAVTAMLGMMVRGMVRVWARRRDKSV